MTLEERLNSRQRTKKSNICIYVIPKNNAENNGENVKLRYERWNSPRTLFQELNLATSQLSTKNNNKNNKSVKQTADKITGDNDSHRNCIYGRMFYVCCDSLVRASSLPHVRFKANTIYMNSDQLVLELYLRITMYTLHVSEHNAVVNKHCTSNAHQNQTRN